MHVGKHVHDHAGWLLPWHLTAQAVTLSASHELLPA